MNAYRALADGFHVLALLVLFVQIYSTKSCKGVSGRSLILFAIVYTSRYLDLLLYFISFYNVFMKLFYLIISYTFIYFVYFRFKKTYEKEYDTFWIELLLLPCIALAYFCNHYLELFEVLWTFSIYLEAVASLPQIHLILKTGKAEKYIMPYLILLCLYRGFYIVNWWYRYENENRFDKLTFNGGVVDVTLLCVFFIYYGIRGGKDIRNNFASNISQVLTNEQLLAQEKEKNNILTEIKPEKDNFDRYSSVYCIGSEKDYKYPNLIPNVAIKK